MESQRKSASVSVCLSSSENDTTITGLIDGMMGQIVKSSSSPASTNAGCTDPSTGATSEDLQVASSKLSDSVLDETEGTSGKQEGNLKSTLSDWKPKLKPAFKKFLVHLNIKNRNPIVRKIPKEELPAEAPAEEPTSTKGKNKKKDQVSTNAPLFKNVNKDVECTDPCTSTTLEGPQVALSKLTDSVLNEAGGTSGKQEENLKSTRSDWKPKLKPAIKKFLVHLNIKNRNPIFGQIPKEELPAEAPAEEPTERKSTPASVRLSSSENYTAITGLIDGIMGQIVESSSSPGSTNAGCTDPSTSATSEDLSNSVLDETEGTSGTQEGNLKSTLSNWKPKLKPAFKKFLVHLNIKNRNPIFGQIPKEELPAKAPAEEPTSTTEKTKKKDQMITNTPLYKNVNEDVECTDPCTSSTSVALSKLIDSVLNEAGGTSGKQEENLKSTRGDWKSKLKPAFKKFLVHLNIKNRNPIFGQIPKEELPAEEPTSTKEKNKKKDQMSTNAPLSKNVNEDVECTDPCTSAASEYLKVASSKLTDSVLNEAGGTSGKQEDNLKSTRGDWKPKIKPALKYLVNLNIKNIVRKTPKEEQPAEAPAEEPTSTTTKKKDQILAFFRRSWRTMKRIFTKRSNKIFPA